MTSSSCFQENKTDYCQHMMQVYLNTLLGRIIDFNTSYSPKKYRKLSNSFSDSSY